MVISAPFIFVGFAIFVGTNNVHARYAPTCLIAIGAFSFGAMCNAWASINTTSDTARAATSEQRPDGRSPNYADPVSALQSAWSSSLVTVEDSSLPGEPLNLLD